MSKCYLLSLQALFIPSVARNPVWMLHCADASLCMTDRENVDTSLRCAPFIMTRRCHSERSEESSAMWMLHCADAPFSMTDRENVDTSLRCAPFSMTRRCHSERSEESSAMWMLHCADASLCRTEKESGNETYAFGEWKIIVYVAT